MDVEQEQSVQSELDSINCLDSLLRYRAETHAEEVLLSYPKPQEHGYFFDLTGRNLERITRCLAVRYGAILERKLGCKIAVTGKREPTDMVVAFVGMSSLEYMLSYLAVQRLGLATMLIAPRLADQGIGHLLRETAAAAALTSGPSTEALTRVHDNLGVPVEIIPILTLDEILRLDDEADQVNFDLCPLQVADRNHSPGLYMHTGGTTGLPKPVRLNSGRWLSMNTNTPSSTDPFQEGTPPPSPNVVTLPLFHSFGQGMLLRTLCNGTRSVWTRAEEPFTVERLRQLMDAVDAKALATVPYILTFFTETDGGLEGRWYLTIWATNWWPPASGSRSAMARRRAAPLWGT
jgi:acyl-CoA synthetase (AMP-forming)/AMP-acid ligase II